MGDRIHPKKNSRRELEPGLYFSAWNFFPDLNHFPRNPRFKIARGKSVDFSGFRRFSNRCNFFWKTNRAKPWTPKALQNFLKKKKIFFLGVFDESWSSGYHFETMQGNQICDSCSSIKWRKLPPDTLDPNSGLSQTNIIPPPIARDSPISSGIPTKNFFENRDFGLFLKNPLMLFESWFDIATWSREPQKNYRALEREVSFFLVQGRKSSGC